MQQSARPVTFLSHLIGCFLHADTPCSLHIDTPCSLHIDTPCSLHSDTPCTAAIIVAVYISDVVINDT